MPGTTFCIPDLRHENQRNAAGITILPPATALSVFPSFHTLSPGLPSLAMVSPCNSPGELRIVRTIHFTVSPPCLGMSTSVSTSIPCLVLKQLLGSAFPVSSSCEWILYIYIYNYKHSYRMLLGFYPNCSVNSHSCPHQSNLSGPQRASNLDRISATRLDSKASSCGMQRSSITGLV